MHKLIPLFGTMLIAITLGMQPATVSAQALFTRPPVSGDRPAATAPPIEIPNLVNLNWRTPNDLFSFIIQILTLVAGLLAFGFLLYGGFKYITSAGDQAAATQGKSIIISSVVGIVIVAISSVLIQFVVSVIRGALG